MLATAGALVKFSVNIYDYPMTKRRYQLKRRAEKQEQTRARIVEAAMALHEEVGPRATTVSAVAERAGVQRLTVYRHFADETALFTACSSHYLALHPPPDPAAWAGEREPLARCRAALVAFYAYYRRTERMWAQATRDEPDVPAIQPVMGELAAFLDTVRDGLLAGWRLSPARRRRVKATLGHALRFSTWQSLAAEGLEDAAMARLVLRWVEIAAEAGAR